MNWGLHTFAASTLTCWAIASALAGGWLCHECMSAPCSQCRSWTRILHCYSTFFFFFLPRIISYHSLRLVLESEPVFVLDRYEWYDWKSSDPELSNLLLPEPFITLKSLCHFPSQLNLLLDSGTTHQGLRWRPHHDSPVAELPPFLRPVCLSFTRMTKMGSHKVMCTESLFCTDGILEAPTVLCHSGAWSSVFSDC